MLLSEIIRKLDETNTNVFNLKNFVRTVLQFANKGEYDKIKQVIEVMNPKEALDNLNKE